jgi:anthocyanidin reductase
VLKACAKAKTVKRVILTSSAAAVSINKLNGTGLVMDEKNWTDVEFLTSEKPPTWVINDILNSLKQDYP